jgi:hypothetical protein
MLLFYQHMNVNGLLKKAKSQFCHFLGLVQVVLLCSFFSYVLSVQISYSQGTVS